MRAQNKASWRANWALRLKEGADYRSKEKSLSKPTITPAWIREQFDKQNGKCAYLHVPLVIPQGLRPDNGMPWQPSLDRIDNALGYTPQNTRLTSWFWNRLRGTMTVEETIDCFDALLQAWGLEVSEAA